MSNNLTRFTDAQEGTYPIALREIKSGRKQSHWMWFIFPQIMGLGNSDTSKLYAIKSLQEAEAYIRHPVLGPRLFEITRALLELSTFDAHEVFGSPDDIKLKSCMTLFSTAGGSDNVFNAALNKFFDGQKDKKTLAVIHEE